MMEDFKDIYVSAQYINPFVVFLKTQLSSGDHDHLHDLSNIQFLVLDEADRMTQEHCFPQMIKILDMIHAANPGDTSDDGESDEEDDEDDEGGNRLMGLPGVPGEAHLAMLSDDILRQIEAQREGMDPESKEIADDSFPTQSEPNDIDEEVKNLEEAMPDEWVVKPRIKRQTFIFSATLTLPFTKTKNAPVATKKRKKLGLDGGIAEILEKTRAMGETKVVDLSSSTSSSNDIRSNSSQHGVGVRLPPGLSVEQIKCTQRHKDSHLYAYLMTTSQGTSGPCLVFCNSIAAVRRVGATLQALGFAVRILHAHMQQVGCNLKFLNFMEGGVDESTYWLYSLKIHTAATTTSQKDCCLSVRCGFY